jgi:hypothetical protein
MSTMSLPLVVQYLYVHEPGETFSYPTARSDSSAARVAVRYLECALTQAASLQLQEIPCELALATNVTDRAVLGRRGVKLLETMESLGVRILPAEYRHRPEPGTEIYVSSRYVLDAIIVACEGQPPDRQLWLTDLDCVWSNPGLVFSHAPAPSEVGCIYIGYPPDFDTVGFNVHGRTRRAIGDLAATMGSSDPVPPWVGGELLTGVPDTLRALVKACEELDETLAKEDKTLPNEEQILSLAGAIGRAHFRDLSDVARRVPTGPRTEAAIVEDPLSIGLWHLPSEKGLSLRRTAHQIRRGSTDGLRRDLSEPARAARRFNVAGNGLPRRLRDDSWIAAQRIHSAARSALRPH